MSYPQALGHMMAMRRGMAVAGTHGKSTTTAMTAAILQAAGIDATVISGAAPLGATSGGHHGRGEWLLAEACEYRGHFHALHPELAVVTGIEWDHMDCFPTLTTVQQAFAGFIANVDRQGMLLANADCPATRRVVDRSRHTSHGLETLTMPTGVP